MRERAHFREPTPPSVCRDDSAQRREEVSAKSESEERMLLLWLLISYILLIKPTTCQNGETLALEPSQELELQCLQRDEEGEVYPTSHSS